MPKSEEKPMGLNKVDKSQEFIRSGMTLITEVDSDKYLKNCKTYDVPKDRMSRPCGGAGGFDDFVERWVD